MNGKQMIRLYRKEGWRVKRITGSHYIMEKRGNIETIPHHVREFRKGIQEKLLKRLKEVK